MGERMNIGGAMVRTTIGLLLLCGLAYPFAMTGLAQAVMPKQANGSMVYNEKGQLLGSKLIGQNFTEPQYFHGRISSIGNDAAGSGSPNYAPSNLALQERVVKSVEEWGKVNPDVAAKPIPQDLLTNSASGLDPHITPEAARVQLTRVAKASGISKERLEQLIEKYTEGRDLGVFGQMRVNVFMLNLEVQHEMKG
ncbi:potassium-transporting ATPase subunit KdpC [Paenibacillus alvei]|uniref:Potassium-transporting ATPase KdpC subunit n=1 Tax=Paenibacillus alvei TaxID=44250 RepID=A0ABT4H6J7_PAEAL|nr:MULTISPECIES: potassium-transporting ATPase subunit KdpC [Paenibacillus]EJW16932.1 potassium-transporting ATPase C chain KdpC [Paenibacillus alvei DSM 29]MCY7486616.1 potassium-transporting ATPase subunit KdpC [Paenibacillus alvei]MCY9543319.1 potassium-transporting ATPase subunit KdpC [Paenibacillus alvei]MCY9708430.1 potassium-transporting ATPase subunit KdpC [Paenibacillus alvei]MCY9734378.1 potassium-transporting ATPase subunit KdpC [Paenibacillus alvei]